MGVNMALTAQPDNIQWFIVTIVMVSIYSGLCTTFLAAIRTHENPALKRTFKFAICCEFFFVRVAVSFTLCVIFLRVFFAPFADEGIRLSRILSGPFNMIFRKMLSIGRNPLLLLTATFRRIAVSLGNLCACECHSLILSHGGMSWQ